MSQQQQIHNKIINTTEINEIKTDGVKINNINSQEEPQDNSIIKIDTVHEANNDNIPKSSTNNAMPPTNSKKIVKVKNKNKNKAQLDVNFSIKYDNNGEEETTHLKYISLKKKQKVNIEYQDIDFLSQSQFRFVLYPLSSSSINNSPQFDYQDLCWVKYYAFETYNCPICLSSELQVPVITRCSHIFCWVCLVTYNNYHALYLQEKKKSRLADCPLCKDKLDLKNDGVMFCDIIKSKHYSMERKDEEANKNDSKISNCNDSFKDINEDINEYNDMKRVNKTNSTNNTTNSKNINTNTTCSYPQRSSFNSNNKNNNSNSNNDQSSNFKSRRSTYNSNNSNQNNSYKKTYSYNSNRNINTMSNNNFISFNLSFRTNFMIYNVHRDKNLSKFYKYNSNTIIPDVNLNQASFSMIFKIEIPELQAMYESKNAELEKLLNQELDDTSTEKDGNDDKRVKACFECIGILKTMINDLKISNNSKKESNGNKTNPNADANTVKKEVDAMRFKYFYQESNGDIYYLNPIDYLILITEYKSIDYLPTKIEVSND